MRAIVSIFALSALSLAGAQERLASLPRFERYAKLRSEISTSVKRAELNAVFAQDGKAFFYRMDGKTFKFDLKSLAAAETTEAMPASENRGGGRRGNAGTAARGRQLNSVTSPDQTLRASYRDRNVYLTKADGSDEVAVTTEGSTDKRTKFGVASWVYGEELGVRDAMWFSPDGRKLAFYGFDESEVKDYFLTLQVAQVQDVVDTEPYPKAGAPNPKVSLMIYDLASKLTKTLDCGPADGIGHYVYRVQWSPNGTELLFNRTNRKQNIMEFCAANPDSGAVRVIVREEWPKSWTTNSPEIRWFEDGKRFIWVSERTGFRNYYLGNIDGATLKPITAHAFEVSSIIRLDEVAGTLWYMARDGDNYYSHQLHRIKLNGTGERRLTNPAFHHSVVLSPNGESFVDTFETIDQAPIVQLCDGTGKVLKELAKSDTSKFDSAGFKRVERIIFKAADGKTDCYGYLMKPSDFDPSKKYPLVVECYGGPESGGGSDRFMTPSPNTELGFLVAWFDGRGTSGRGKAFEDEVYGKLGIIEIDDQAAGVKALAKRPYVDSTRVGICGTSYGGYTSVMAIVRYPDVFRTAVASSPVTAWTNYDSIYTERYMGLPWDSENKSGYEAGSAMTYAKDFRGNLILFYGTADNNVHPANTYQLAQALTRAGKSFYMLAGPDQGHSGIPSHRQWEFFIETLILNRN